MQDNTLQNFREKYIIRLDELLDNKKVEALAEDLFSLDLTMYSKNYCINSILYNALAISTIDEEKSLHPAQLEILSIINIMHQLLVLLQALEKLFVSLNI